MKVVHVIEALGGGVYTYFKDLSHFMGQEQVMQQAETFIVYSAKRKEIIPENIQKEFSSNVTLIELDMEREFHPIKDLQATFRLRKLFLDLQPDVIHLHSSKAGVIGRWAKFLTFRKPAVFYTPHGYAFLRLDISAKKRKFYQWVEKYTQKIFGGTTIACGDTEYEMAKGMGKATLVRNGIDVSKFVSLHKPNTSQRLRVGIVGRITFARNPELFNKIALLFPDYQFVWIGDGELKHLITAPNIEITGWLFDESEVYKQMNTLDVYLQTSLWEGLPIALLEAMLYQKPIVATNVIGNKDAVKPNETGFLFQSIAELQPIFEKLEDASFREKMGEMAYARVVSKFNTQINFQKLLKVYLSSVAKNDR